MKALICELCGGQEFEKQGDFFVCKSCNTKYTTEDAQKLMVEVTVKNDNSEKLKNDYVLARRARENGDRELAKRYYNEILSNDPNSWEANFYAVYYRSASCIIAHITSACNDVSNVLQSVFKLIKNDASVDKSAAIEEIIVECNALALTMISAARNHFDSIGSSIQDKYRGELAERKCAAINILFTCSQAIETVFADDKELLIKCIVPEETALRIVLKEDTTFKAEYINKRLERLEKYDSNFVSDYKQRLNQSSNAGCIKLLAFPLLIAGIVFLSWGIFDLVLGSGGPIKLIGGIAGFVAYIALMIVGDNKRSKSIR